MTRYAELSGSSLERVRKWLATTEYAVLQKALESSISGIFDACRDREIQEPVEYLKNRKLHLKSEDDLTQAMRLQICSDVLQEILTGKIKLKSERHVEDIQEREEQ